MNKKGTPVNQDSIQVRNFIFENITAYDGGSDFLVGPSDKTKKLWEKVKKLLKKEIEKGGVLGIDTKVVSNIISHNPGYIDKELESIVGLQTVKYPFCWTT